MNIFENIKFGDIFETESGRQIVFTGYPFLKSRYEDKRKYMSFMFNGDREISLYNEDFGPYAYSSGSDSIFSPTKPDRIISKVLLSNDERTALAYTYLECVKEVNTVKCGEGCKVGEIYRFEYVSPHDENECFKPFYRKLTDNTHYDEVYITDEELLNNFIEYNR